MFVIIDKQVSTVRENCAQAMAEEFGDPQGIRDELKLCKALHLSLARGSKAWQGSKRPFELNPFLGDKLLSPALHWLSRTLNIRHTTSPAPTGSSFVFNWLVWGFICGSIDYSARRMDHYSCFYSIDVRYFNHLLRSRLEDASMIARCSLQLNIFCSQQVLLDTDPKGSVAVLALS